MITYIIFFLLLIVSHVAYFIYTHPKNHHDFPVGINPTCIFHEETRCACNIFAKGIFFILTGIDLNCLPILGINISHCSFDDKNLDELDLDTKYVKYIGLSWDVKDGYAFHALVYYDGYLYQSFGKYHYKWKWLHYDFLSDSYPPIAHYLTPSQKLVFTEENFHMTTKMFNEICAPSKGQLPENTTFTVVNYYAAKPNIHRHDIKIQLL